MTVDYAALTESRRRAHEYAQELALSDRERAQFAESCVRLARSALDHHGIPQRSDLTHPHWPAFFPRPGDDRPTDQAAWDEAEAKRQRAITDLKALREREAAEAQAKQEALAQAEQERREAEYAQLVSDLRRRYLATPGATDADFQAALPELLAEYRKSAVLRQADADSAARAAQRRRIAREF